MEPLVSASELNDYLQRSVPPAVAALAVAGASGIVRAHCGWNISRDEGITFEVDGSGTRVLSLPSLRVTAVDLVVENGTDLEADAVQWSRSGQLYRATAFPRFTRYEVVCDSGYDPIPDVCKIVTLSLAGRLLANPQGLKAATVGAVQRTYADATLNTLELALLDSFRLP